MSIRYLGFSHSSFSKPCKGQITSDSFFKENQRCGVGTASHPWGKTIMTNMAYWSSLEKLGLFNMNNISCSLSTISIPKYIFKDPTCHMYALNKHML